MIIMEFIDAQMYWDLDALYTDIALIKRIKLTEWEKNCLCGLLCGYHPEAIASKIFWTASALRTELSRRLYPYISTLVGEDKIAWHRVAKLLEKAGYKYPALKILKRDLLTLNFFSNSNYNSQVIRASVIIDSLEKHFFKDKSSIVVNFNEISNLEAQKKLIQQGDKSSKDGNFSNAINSYQKVLMLNPSLVGVLIKIARCYDRLQLYKDSLFICDYALYHLEKNKSKSLSDTNTHKTEIYNFLAGIFHELALNTYHSSYVKTAFEIYQQALYFSPWDTIVAWNIVDFFISVFQDSSLTPEEQNEYIARAKKALYDFQGTASRPESKFKLDREAIILDAERSFEGLDEWWQEQLNELKSL